MTDRRTFLRALPIAALFTLGARPARTLAHPEPRPGITGANVLTDVHDPAVRRLFEQVRRIPQVVDGIQCYCGCAEIPGHYSLLSCFEKDGMAQHCEICQGEAQLANELNLKGQSLAQIRAAIDLRYAR